MIALTLLTILATLLSIATVGVYCSIGAHLDRSAGSYAWVVIVAALAVGAWIGVCLLASRPAAARDTTGLSAQLSPELNEWVRGLKGKRGIGCCDDSDGIDPVWDIHGGRYRVMFKGQWLIVDDDALLKKPNRLGVARAWIGGIGTDRPFVRCFLPGPTI